MPTTVNSRFLPVATKEPSLDSGFQIRVLDYKDMTTLVAIMPEFTAFAFTQQLSDPGLGSVTLDTDSPWWNETLNNGLSNFALRDREYVFEIWENGLRRFAFLGKVIEQHIVEEDGSHQTTISGPGIGNVLTWACIQRPGWPKKVPVIRHETIQVGSGTKQIPVYRDVASSDKLSAFNWRFPMQWTTMRMYYTVLKAAQRRGVIPFVKLLFNGVQDSGKQPWAYVRTLQTITDDHGFQPETPEENLLDFLNDCTGQDYSKWFGQRLEWMMYPGFRLDVRRRIGVDRSKTVQFFTGQVVTAVRTRDRDSIRNRITAVDVDGNESIATSKASIETWNVREQRNDTNKNITDPNLRAQLASRYLEQQKNEKSTWSIQIPYDDPGRIPFRHFFVGDDISVTDTANPFMNRTPKYRVMAISLSMTADSTVPDVELTLQSVIDTRMLELEKRVTQLINEPRNFEIEQLKNVDISTTPTKKAPLVFNPESKKWEADENFTSGGGGGGGRIFVQSQDPATQPGVTIQPGDFWLETYD